MSRPTMDEVSPVPLRAALYGDALFETMRIHSGALPLLDRHLDRLARDAPRIGFRLPERAALVAWLSETARERASATLRLALFAPDGARGYARGEVEPVLHRELHPGPAPDAKPLRLAVSTVRLPAPDPLAGAKHANRLAQVLAARQRPAEADEALLLDPMGRPVCGLSGNLWAVVGGQLLTPPIVDCGVRGVMRDWLLELGPELGIRTAETSLTLDALRCAEELFLSNALRGLRPVGSLTVGPACHRPGSAAYTRCLAAALEARGFPVQLPELP